MKSLTRQIFERCYIEIHWSALHFEIYLCKIFRPQELMYKKNASLRYAGFLNVDVILKTQELSPQK